MAHINGVKCVDISEEKIFVYFEKVHVNVVNVPLLRCIPGFQDGPASDLAEGPALQLKWANRGAHRAHGVETTVLVVSPPPSPPGYVPDINHRATIFTCYCM